MSITLASWHRLWRELGAPQADEALFRDLVAHYSESHRHYHTLQHLRECLDKFEAVRDLAWRPAEIELALWFHDAFYEPQRKDNEQRSADWARDSVLAAGLGEDVARRVHALVMATQHVATPQDDDARLLVDVDLAILGADTERFDESDEQIRAEFSHLSESDFRRGRRGVLEGFLARPTLYTTDLFREGYEAPARRNLKRSLSRL